MVQAPAPSYHDAPPILTADPPPEHPGVPDRPTLASGVELVGRQQGGGYQAQQWLVRRGPKFVQVTELLYRVLESADGRATLADVARAVTAATGRPVSAKNVAYLIEQRLLPLGLIARDDTLEGAAPKSDVRSPLKIILRKKVLPPAAINPFTSVLRAFFWPPILLATLLVVAVTQVWAFAIHGLDAAVRETFARPELLLVLGAIGIVSAIFHEFGHASALRYGGGRVRGMGVGLYIIYPAFYTDVTDSYRLGRWARVRTDLGGVYFNLIFSLPIVALYFATHNEYLLLFLLFTDLEILDQFSPILRFDGYWMLADLTGLPDFFSLMGPFLRSVLPFRWWKGPRLPALKRWVKAVFALYCLLAIPVLGLLMTTLVVNAPYLLSLTWRSLSEYAVGWQMAFQAGDAREVALQTLRMLLVGLPALGLVVSLLYTGRRVARALRGVLGSRLGRKLAFVFVVLCAMVVLLSSSA